jgi:hypothetical protein
MTVILQRALVRVPEPIAKKAARKALLRFDEAHRARVLRTAAAHPALADLAVSFPALLFSVAVPRAGFDPAATLAGAIAGDRLADLARTANVPLWTRKLPPDAFTEPLGRLPSGERFRLRIGNHLPKTKPARWLTLVQVAHACGGEALALWIARIATETSDDIAIDALRRVCLWAWVSLRPETFAGSLCQDRWQPSMTRGTAFMLTDRYLTTLDGRLRAGANFVADPWCEPGTHEGYTFTPILTARALAVEAHRMTNCANTYMAAILNNECQLWSVSRGDVTVAMLALNPVAAADGAYPVVTEIRGPCNAGVAREVQAAVAWWWLLQPAPKAGLLDRKTPASSGHGHGYDQATWQRLWKPYWIANGRIPKWLPLQLQDWQTVWSIGDLD